MQKLPPPLHDAQDQIVSVGVSRRQMPGIHQAMDVALSFASGFEQGFERRAFINVTSDVLPPLLLPAPSRVIRKLWCVDQCIEIVRYAGCSQDGFSGC